MANSIDRETQWHPHAVAVDLKDNNDLLQHLGLDQAEEIAGPRAMTEVDCRLTKEWKSYQPGLQAMYRDDLAVRYEPGAAWSVNH